MHCLLAYPEDGSPLEVNTLFNLLAWRPFETLDKLRRRVDGYIVMEKVVARRKKNGLQMVSSQ